MNNEIIIIKLKAYAEANYDNGMDVFVECNGEQEWQELVDQNGGDMEKCKAEMRELSDYYEERQQDAINSAF